MTNHIYSEITASISELKANPMKIVESSDGESIAILNRNKPAFYCVPAELYENLMEMLDDAALIKTIEKRRKDIDDGIEVNIDDL